MSDRKTKASFEPSGFFVLRTPLLPFDEMEAWSDGLEAVDAVSDPDELAAALARDSAVLNGRLCRALARAELREALFLASPDLEEASEAWTKGIDSQRGRSLEPALVSYFSRAVGRPTPFGLFAGSTLGVIGSRTSLQLVRREDYRRQSRLDMDFLWALAEAMEREPTLRPIFTYRPNSSLYEVTGGLRLAENRLSGTARSYHLVAVAKTPYLMDTLARAQRGATLEELAAGLVDDDITLADAEEFIGELIDSQILVADIRPPVTGIAPVASMISALRGRTVAATVGNALEKARAELDGMDRDGVGASPDRYRAVASLLQDLAARPELSRLVQVDMVKPAENAVLGANVIAEIGRGLRALHAMAAGPGADGLARFREAFVHRYETREVALTEVLDEESGIGFERSASPLAEASPLLAGLPLGTRGADRPEWRPRDALLLQKLARAGAHREREINLDRAEVDSLAAADPPLPLPEAFDVIASVAASSPDAFARGDFRVLLHASSGPSGARLLGRFCQGDDGLHAAVREHLVAEEARKPDAVFAEVVHLPEGRVGNILCRPVLRNYEIPYLGGSGAPEDRQIPITDLLVSVQGDRVVLRSTRLDVEVVPRLTTAHNYGWRSLGIYRFLCALQTQHVNAGLMWDWGPLSQLPFLPRVVSGRTVLARARWNLTGDDLRALRDNEGALRFAAAQTWRTQHDLPRFVALADGDNELVIDLDNMLCLDALAHQLKGRNAAALIEMFPGPEDLCVSSPEGRFVHQLVIPFVSSAEPSARRPTHAVPSRGARRFPPGSEWLYAKLYGGTAAADHVLDLAGHVGQQAVRSGSADRWFFIRYNDPEPHLRVRLHGDPGRLAADVRPMLDHLGAELVDTGHLWRVQFDTYEREVERYGGDRGVVLAEQLFHADSDAVLAIVGELSGDLGADSRWRLALRGIDLLFDDFGFEFDDKRAIARRARDGYRTEFGVSAAFHESMSQRFRTERASLEALLDDRGIESPELTAALDAFRVRSAAFAPVAAELRRLEAADGLHVPIGDLMLSFAHMHVNRMLRAAQRAQELVFYELLDRLYTSKAGRAAAGVR